MAKDYDLRIEVPTRLRRFLTNPSPYIDRTMREADSQALTLLQTDIKAITHKKSGALANSVTVDLIGRKVFTKSQYGRAYQLGHYARPVRKKMLHFVNEVGKDIFLKATRSKRLPFFFETLNKNRLKIRQIYDKAFNRIMEKA